MEIQQPVILLYLKVLVLLKYCRHRLFCAYLKPNTRQQNIDSFFTGMMNKVQCYQKTSFVGPGF